MTLGGSASTDGGQGILTALGARFLDASGTPVGLGNRSLSRIAQIDISGLRRVPAGTDAVVLSDVTNPLLGDDGAVAVFGEQKGILPQARAEAETNLEHFSRALADVLPADPSGAGAGAAGGAGFALSAWGAASRSGAEMIGSILRIEPAIRSASLVITGEGRYDDQSESGKATGFIRGLAAASGLPCILVAGQVAGGEGLFAERVSLSKLAGSSEAARRDPARWLSEAGRRLAVGVRAGSTGGHGGRG